MDEWMIDLGKGLENPHGPRPHERYEYITLQKNEGICDIGRGVVLVPRF
jgi:hypothetical protein